MPLRHKQDSPEEPPEMSFDEEIRTQIIPSLSPAGQSAQLQSPNYFQHLWTARRYFQGSTSSKSKRKKAPAKRGAPTKAASKKPSASEKQPDQDDDTIPRDEIEGEVDELDASDDEDTLPKKRPKKKACEDTPDIEATAYIFIVIAPPPTAHVRAKAAKPPPEQHRKRPPFMFNIDLSYADFVSKVASATPCYPEALMGMMWKFEKPIKGDTKPLTTEISYAAMIKQLHDKTKDHVINIYMPPLNKLDHRPTFVCDYYLKIAS